MKHKIIISILIILVVVAIAVGVSACKLQTKIDPNTGEEVVSGTFPSFASLTNPGIIESHKYTKGGSKLDCNMGQFCSAIYNPQPVGVLSSMLGFIAKSVCSGVIGNVEQKNITSDKKNTNKIELVKVEELKFDDEVYWYYINENSKYPELVQTSKDIRGDNPAILTVYILKNGKVVKKIARKTLYEVEAGEGVAISPTTPHVMEYKYNDKEGTYKIDIFDLAGKKLCTVEYPYDFVIDFAKNEKYFYIVDSMGEAGGQLKYFDITGKELWKKNGITTPNLALMNDGKVLLAIPSGIEIYNPDGTLKTTIISDDTENQGVHKFATRFPDWFIYSSWKKGSLDNINSNKNNEKSSTFITKLYTTDGELKWTLDDCFVADHSLKTISPDGQCILLERYKNNTWTDIEMKSLKDLKTKWRYKRDDDTIITSYFVSDKYIFMWEKKISTDNRKIILLNYNGEIVYESKPSTSWPSSICLRKNKYILLEEKNSINIYEIREVKK